MKKRFPKHYTLKELREANYWSVKWWKNKVYRRDSEESNNNKEIITYQTNSEESF